MVRFPYFVQNKPLLVLTKYPKVIWCLFGLPLLYHFVFLTPMDLPLRSYTLGGPKHEGQTYRDQLRGRGKILRRPKLRRWTTGIVSVRRQKLSRLLYPTRTECSQRAPRTPACTRCPFGPLFS